MEQKTRLLPLCLSVMTTHQLDFGTEMIFEGPSPLNYSVPPQVTSAAAGEAVAAGLVTRTSSSSAPEPAWAGWRDLVANHVAPAMPSNLRIYAPAESSSSLLLLSFLPFMLKVCLLVLASTTAPNAFLTKLFNHEKSFPASCFCAHGVERLQEDVAKRFVWRLP